MCVSWLFRGNSIWLSRLPFSCLVKNSITRSDDYLWLFTEIASSALGQCVVGTLSAVPSCQVIDTLLSAPRFVSIHLILYAEMGKTDKYLFRNCFISALKYADVKLMEIQLPSTR